MSIKANAIESLNKSLSMFRKLGSREGSGKLRQSLGNCSKSQDSNDFHPTDKSSKRVTADGGQGGFDKGH